MSAVCYVTKTRFHGLSLLPISFLINPKIPLLLPFLLELAVSAVSPIGPSYIPSPRAWSSS